MYIAVRMLVLAGLVIVAGCASALDGPAAEMESAPPVVTVSTDAPAAPAETDPPYEVRNDLVHTNRPEVQAKTPENYRFNMRQNGANMSADQFEEWMRANGIRMVGEPAGQPEEEAAE